MTKLLGLLRLKFIYCTLAMLCLPAVAMGDRICSVAQQPGSDIGAKINACDTALGADKGEIVLTGGGNIATQVVISSNHTLRIVSGAYTASTNNAVIRLKDFSSLVCDSWRPVIQESDGIFVNTSPMTIVTAWKGSGPEPGALNGNLSQGISVRGCHLQGKADIKATVSIAAGTGIVTATKFVFNANQVVDASRYNIRIAGAGARGGTLNALIMTTPTGTKATLNENALTTVSNAPAIIESFNSAYPGLYLGNCHNCEIRKNWLDGTHSIGIQAGGGSSLGYYAKNNVIEGNLLTEVASQNIAVTNAEGVIVRGNYIFKPGQDGGPGVSVIDIEPNVGDRTRNISIEENWIDTTESLLDSEVNSQKVSHGIVIQNGNGAAPFADVVVAGNHVLGTRLSQTGYHLIGGAGILVRTAVGVTVRDNYVQRAGYCVLVDYGATATTVTGNQCNSNGSGSSPAITILNANNNKIYGNTLWADINDAFGTTTNASLITANGTSTGNVFNDNSRLGDVGTARPSSMCGSGIVCMTSGAGSPEGVITAATGSTYRRTGSAPGALFYLKERGTGNTGWVAKW